MTNVGIIVPTGFPATANPKVIFPAARTGADRSQM